MASSPPPEPSPAPVSCSDWLRLQPAQGADPSLSPQQLAWLGDAVWELHQRLRLCRGPARVDALHRTAVARVRADAQARALRRLEPLLQQEERRQVRRGRNQAGRGPRHGDPAHYGMASGFETMLGWLFLLNPRRLAELLDHLEETDPPPPPAVP